MDSLKISWHCVGGAEHNGLTRGTFDLIIRQIILITPTTRHYTPVYSLLLEM